MDAWVSVEQTLYYFNLELGLLIRLMSECEHFVNYGSIGLSEYTLYLIHSEGRPRCVVAAVLYVQNVYMLIFVLLFRG